LIEDTITEGKFYRLVSLQSGGVTLPWNSAAVIVPLICGILSVFTFAIWEWKWARYPMLPAGIFKGQRVTGFALGICFVAGMNLFALLSFIPLAMEKLYNPDPLQVGLKGLGYGFAAIIGGIVMNALLSVLPNRNREILLVSCLMMSTFLLNTSGHSILFPTSVLCIFFLG
jgi:hypothetical protein